MREVESKGRIRFTTFYANRIRRLLPLSAVVVLGTLLLARIWSSVFLVKSITTDAVYTAFYALNYRLAGQGDRLPAGQRAAVTAAALLVARGGGAVLLRCGRS